MLWVALHFPLLPQSTLEAIGAWACQFTPKVSLEPPRALLLEVEGSLRLFGGLPPLKQKLKSGIEEMGFNAALATAATPRAALWLSYGKCESIDDVALEAACNEEESFSFLKNIGINTVGELSRLPREGRGAGAARLLRAAGALPRQARAAGSSRSRRRPRLRGAAAPGAARGPARRAAGGDPPVQLGSDRRAD